MCQWTFLFVPSVVVFEVVVVVVDVVMWKATNWYSFFVKAIYNTREQDLNLLCSSEASLNNNTKGFSETFARNQNIFFFFLVLLRMSSAFNSNQNLFLLKSKKKMKNLFFQRLSRCGCASLCSFFVSWAWRVRENKSVKKIMNLTPEKENKFFFGRREEAKAAKAATEKRRS